MTKLVLLGLSVLFSLLAGDFHFHISMPGTIQIDSLSDFGSNEPKEPEEPKEPKEPNGSGIWMDGNGGIYEDFKVPIALIVGMNVSDSGDCHCDTNTDLNEFCRKYCDLWNNYLSELTRQPNLKEPKELKEPNGSGNDGIYENLRTIALIVEIEC